MRHHSGNYLGLLRVPYNPVYSVAFWRNDIRFHFTRFVLKPKMTNASVTKKLEVLHFFSFLQTSIFAILKREVRFGSYTYLYVTRKVPYRTKAYVYL